MLKVFDTINPKEGFEVGEAQTPEEALALLTAYFKDTGEDRLVGVTTADCDSCFEGEVYVPILAGINDLNNDPR